MSAAAITASGPSLGDVCLQGVGLTKRYGRIVALNNVDIELRAGEVMGLAGENGAGKSTIVKILAGLATPDEGKLTVSGHPVHFGSTAASEAAGIAVVQQELSLVGTMSIAENVVLGHPHAGWWRSARTDRRMTMPRLEQVGLGETSPDTLVSDLSVAEQQLVEIARLLARDARILVLDEPTSALSAPEIQRVKGLVTALARDGRAIIYVTHHLEEIFELCDRVIVLRNGSGRRAQRAADLSIPTLIEQMLGRPLDDMFPEPPQRRAPKSGPAALSVEGLLTDALAHPASLEARAGEIVALVGQLGSGASTVLQALGGSVPIDAGAVHVEGRVTRIKRPRDAARAGLAYCSANRKLDGFYSGLSAAENLTAPSLKKITPWGWRRPATERALATSLAKAFALDPARLGTEVWGLSGGNQQKVVLAKWLGTTPVVLLVDEPTRGVDVGARREIYTQLRGLADRGLGIVFASSDVQEALGLADRGYTFFHGRLIREFDRTAGVTEVMRDITAPDRSGA